MTLAPQPLCNNIESAIQLGALALAQPAVGLERALLLLGRVQLTLELTRFAARELAVLNARLNPVRDPCLPLVDGLLTAIVVPAPEVVVAMLNRDVRRAARVPEADGKIVCGCRARAHDSSNGNDDERFLHALPPWRSRLVAGTLPSTIGSRPVLTVGRQ
jgi:hypothetical protein